MGEHTRVRVMRQELEIGGVGFESKLGGAIRRGAIRRLYGARLEPIRLNGTALRQVCRIPVVTGVPGQGHVPKVNAQQTPAAAADICGAVSPSGAEFLFER